MTLPNRDTYVAILLLVFCGVMIWASFDIRDPDYGTLAPATWPRGVLAVLTVFSLIYFSISTRAGADDPTQAQEDRAEFGPGVIGLLRKYRNPIWCYAIYLAFLVTLPVFGALIGGILLVFALLCALGGFAPRNMAIHAVIAIISMGAMWSIFTFGLNVILPQGMIFTTL